MNGEFRATKGSCHSNHHMIDARPFRHHDIASSCLSTCGNNILSGLYRTFHSNNFFSYLGVFHHDDGIRTSRYRRTSHDLDCLPGEQSYLILFRCATGFDHADAP